MAEETKEIAEETTPKVVVSDVTVRETLQPEPENVPETPEKVSAPAIGESKVEDEKKKRLVAESNSFKEESNKVEELPNPEQKTLAEFKIQEALNKHEFTSPPPPAKEEDEKKTVVSADAPAEVPEALIEAATDAPEPVIEAESEPVTEKKVETEELEKTEEKVTPPETESTPAPEAAAPSEPSAEEKVEEVEEIKE